MRASSDPVVGISARRASKLLLPALAVGLALIALSIRVAYATSNPTLDDAFITFRYVRNLALGLGFTYNPGEPVLGTTTPLFTLLLVPAAFFGADITIIAKVINILASTANVLLIFLIGGRVFGRFPALLAAMLFAITPSSVWAASTGMETELNVLLLLTLVACYVTSRFRWLGVISALAFMTRPDDLILIAIILALHLLGTWHNDRRLSWPAIEPIAIFVVCLLPWIVFASAYFGSPLPASIMGKAAAFRVPVADNLGLYFEQFGFDLHSPRAIASTLAFLLGIVEIARSDRRLLVAPLYFVAYSAAFVLLGARLGSGWYWQPLWGSYCLIFAGGVKWIIGLVRSIPAWQGLPARWKNITTVVLAAAVAIVWTGSLQARFLGPKTPDELLQVEQAQAFREAGEWLEANSRSDAIVQVDSVGAIGWYSRRYVLDEGGLVSPQVQGLNAKLGTRDTLGILIRFQPDYYLAWTADVWSPLLTTAQQGWFLRHYQPVASFGKGNPGFFVMFKRICDSRSGGCGDTGAF